MAVLGKVLKGGIKVTSTLQNQRRIKPAKWQKKTLAKLMEKARFTQFGEKYLFNDILNDCVFEEADKYYQTFKKNVPIFDYNTLYREWWSKSRKGDKDVCWPGKVKHFALSSGTSESSSKAIPVTKNMVKAIHTASINQIISLGKYPDIPADIYEKGYLMLGGSTLLNQVDSHYEGDLSGITQGAIPFWFQGFYKPGVKIAQERNWANKLEEITQNAPNWDIGFIAGVPAWIQILMEKIIDKYQLNNIHEIWPNLTAFAWGGVSFEPYRKGFEKLLGRPIHYIETYLASEGFLAYQPGPGTDLQLILNNGIFFEFVPFTRDNFDDDGNIYPTAETLMISEVKIGIDYAILISTCSGAWRYLIGDTIRFTDVSQAFIRITGRTKHYLSLCGEHLSVDNMNKAMDGASRHFGATFNEFTVVGIKHPPLFAHQWYIGTDDPIDEIELGTFIDATLRELNDDYAVEREHALKNVFCRVLPTRAFYDWMKMRGKEGGQNKFPRVLKGTMQDDWESFLRVHYPHQIIP